jgi:hypothetical protein
MSNRNFSDDPVIRRKYLIGREAALQALADLKANEAAEADRAFNQRAAPLLAEIEALKAEREQTASLVRGWVQARCPDCYGDCTARDASSARCLVRDMQVALGITLDPQSKPRIVPVDNQSGHDNPPG